jgi:hypothetical protein
MIFALRRILYWTLRPAWRLLLRVMPVDDPWQRVEYRVPVRRYGFGSSHDFSWYFEGQSLVDVRTLDELQDWLMGCEYVQDEELFHETDFWQHPRTFERLRRGDCEDHALWAWRKLLELGYDAELVSGRTLPWQPGVAEAERGHVWVVFRQDEEMFLLEAVSKKRDRVIRRLDDVKAHYRPEYGVDRQRQRFAFNGAIHTMREREFGLRSLSSAPHGLA